MPRLLLINPGHLGAPKWGWRSFPAHLHHLWSALSRDSHVDVADYNVLFGAPAPESRPAFLTAVRDDLSRREFDVAGISCWSSLNVTASIAVARMIREIKPGVRIMVGGYHPSARPDDFPPELFDSIARGCGIEALRHAIRGEGAESRVVEGAAPEIALPRWDGFPYSAIGGAVGIYLSRGCPYRCSFCMEGVMGRKWMALAPADAAGAVVEAINVTKTPFLQIYDPLFGLNPKWRRAFLSELRDRRRKFEKKTFIWAQVRSDTMTEDDVKSLRKFRVQLAVGLESASPTMLGIMNKTRKPGIYLKRFAEFSAYLDRKKVHHQIFLIFNHPGETPETLDEARGWLMGLLGKKRKSYLTALGQKYVFFPGSPLEARWGEYESKYGAKVFHPRWWLEDDDHHAKAGAVIPSMALEKSGQLNRWMDIMLEVNTLNLEIASKANRPDVESFRKQFETLQR